MTGGRVPPTMGSGEPGGFGGAARRPRPCAGACAGAGPSGPATKEFWLFCARTVSRSSTPRTRVEQVTAITKADRADVMRIGFVLPALSAFRQNKHRAHYQFIRT